MPNATIRRLVPALSLILAATLAAPAAAQPRRWQVPVAGQTVDVLDLVPGHGIVVGGVDPEYPALALRPVPDYRELSLHDADTGAVRWRFDRRALRAVWIDLLGVDPILLAYTGSDRRSSGYLALDTSTGRELWRSTDYDWLRPAPDGRFAVALAPGFFSTELVGLSLADGTKRWSRPAPKDLPPGAIDFVGDLLIQLGDAVTRLALADGKPLWSAPWPVAQPQALRLMAAADTLLAFDATRLIALDPRDGSRRWLWQAPEAVLTSLAAIGTDLIAYQRFADGQGLTALSAADGQPRWSVRESRRLTSPSLAVDARLCYTTDIFLVCRDTADGRESLRAPLPYAFVLRDAAPRRLARVGDRLVVACESAVAGWDLPSGAWVWRDDHTSRTHLPLRLSSVSNAAAPATADRGARSAVPAPAPAAAAPSVRPSDFHVWQAQRNLDFARSRLFGAASPAQRREAQSQVAMAAQQAGIAQSLHRAAERNEAIRSLGATLIGALDALGASVRQASAAGQAWSDADGLRASDAMLQGRWHLRQLAFSDALQIIDAGTGNATQLNLDLPFAQSDRSKVRRFVVVDDGKALLTTSPHEQRTERKPTGQGKDGRITFSTFQQYLTVIDIERLEFKPLSGKSHDMWLSTAEAIAVGDLVKLRKGLSASGKFDADSSAFTLHATTPLMTAAYLGKAEIAQWLLDQGADPRKTDRAGWTALDYARAAGQASMVEMLGGSTK